LESSTQTVFLGSLKLHVAIRGAGPPLLFVHGFPLDHTSWQPQLEAFSTQARVIVPDLRGFGRSDVTPGKVTMERFADDLAELLDALQVEEPVTLCGLSMGGYIAWQFWLRHRSRLGRLILCDTRSAADSPEAAVGRRQNADRVLQHGVRPLAEAMLTKLFAPATAAQHPELISQIQQVMCASPVEGVAAALRGMAERPDMTARLPEIDLPALIICGALDGISPPVEMREMADTMPHATYVEIPHAGHLAPLENPAAVNAAMRAWLHT
jgi:pimeloyl-ACP methyl ester carboxylesterase